MLQPNTRRFTSVYRVLSSLRDSQVASQFGWLAAAKVVQGVSGLVASLAVARALGPAEFGGLSLAISIASFVAIIAALGLEQIATRDLVMTNNETRTLLLLRRLRWSGAFMGTIVLVVATAMPRLQSLGAGPALLVLALLPLTQVGDLAEWRLLAAGQGRRVAMAYVVVSPLAALARIALATASVGILAFAWVLVIEWALRSLLLMVMARSCTTRNSQTAGPRLRELLGLLRESAPLLLSGIAVFAYMRIDQFMIAAMLGQEQVGLYSAVVTLSEVPLILPTLLLRATLPTLARQSQKSVLLRDNTLLRLMGLSLYFHIGVTVLLALLAEPLVVLAYGKTYQPAVVAFRIQVFAAPLVALGVLSSGWLVLERRMGHALRRTLLGAGANIGLNIYLIPTCGIAGAAFATLISQMLATWFADALYRDTQVLFVMKTRALWPGNWRST